MLRVAFWLAILGGSAAADTITTTTTVTIETGDVPLAPPSAVAPVPASPPPREHAVFLTLASGGGLGFDTKDGCASLECVALSGSFGIAVMPHVAVVASGIVMDEPAHVGRASHHVETLGVRYALARAWAEAGLGIGSKRTWMYDEPPPMDLTGVDPAASLAVGYQALVRDDYALGVAARVASTVTDVHHTCFAQLAVGVTFY